MTKACAVFAEVIHLLHPIKGGGGGGERGEQNFGQFCRWLQMVFGEERGYFSDSIVIHMSKKQIFLYHCGVFFLHFFFLGGGGGGGRDLTIILLP